MENLRSWQDILDYTNGNHSGEEMVSMLVAEIGNRNKVISDKNQLIEILRNHIAKYITEIERLKRGKA